MKEYETPTIIEEEIEVEDVIMKSFGEDSNNDIVVTNFWE